MLTIADKIALALCYADHPELEEYLSHLEYDRTDTTELNEGVNFFNLGQRFYDNFLSCGFTKTHLSEIFAETNCDY